MACLSRLEALFLEVTSYAHSIVHSKKKKEKKKEKKRKEKNKKKKKRKRNLVLVDKDAHQRETITK